MSASVVYFLTVGLVSAVMAGTAAARAKPWVTFMGVILAVTCIAVGTLEHARNSRTRALTQERCTVAGGWWSAAGVTLPDSTVHCLAAPPTLPIHRDTSEENRP